MMFQIVFIECDLAILHVVYIPPIVSRRSTRKYTDSSHIVDKTHFDVRTVLSYQTKIVVSHFTTEKLGVSHHQGKCPLGFCEGLPNLLWSQFKRNTIDIETITLVHVVVLVLNPFLRAGSSNTALSELVLVVSRDDLVIPSSSGLEDETEEDDDSLPSMIEDSTGSSTTDDLNSCTSVVATGKCSENTSFSFGMATLRVGLKPVHFNSSPSCPSSISFNAAGY